VPRLPAPGTGGGGPVPPVGPGAMAVSAGAWCQHPAGRGYVLEAPGRTYGVTIGPVCASFTLAGKVRELYAAASWR